MKKLITISCILILLAGRLLAQGSAEPLRIAYENALLDSAYKLELLKPVLFNLQNAYTYQGKEIEVFRNALRLSELQNTVQRQSFEAQLAEYKKRYKKGFWRGFKWGFGTGSGTGLLAGLSATKH